MKLATYNIWNDEAGMPYRFQQITDEITKTCADIICLQEVADDEQHNKIAAACGYHYFHYQAQTGLSILSRLPLYAVSDLEFGTMAYVPYGTKSALIINVHLPWESVLERERIIVDLVRGLPEQKNVITFLMGDFNSAADSSIHRFLTNQQSLLGSDAYFYDLAEVSAEIMGADALATLDFRKNPRWGVAQSENTIEVNQRFDWIMMKNPYPLEFPKLIQCSLFGMEISGETGLAASDHYGVCAEIEI